eukprot:scaffold13027_cov22-Tisochrysis_lutea.AAC.2
MGNTCLLTGEDWLCLLVFSPGRRAAVCLPFISSGPLTLQHLLAKSACERVAANACATTCRHHLVPTPAAHAHRPRAHM